MALIQPRPIKASSIIDRGLGLGVAAHDPVADGDQGGETLAVKGVVVLLALGQDPHGLARPAVLDSDLGGHLLGVSWVGVDGEGVQPAGAKACQDVLDGEVGEADEAGAVALARNKDEVGLAIEAALARADLAPAARAKAEQDILATVKSMLV